MRGSEKIEQALASGSVRAFEMAEIYKRIRLVEKNPVGNTVTERLSDELHVVGEPARGVTIGPASGVFERLRQIPVIKRDQRPDARFKQRVNQPAVVIHSLGIRRAGTGGLNARPGNRKPVAVLIHGANQGNVVAPAIIGIAGHVARVAIFDFARRVREAVPDGFALAVFVPRALDLVSGRGRAPEESLGKRDYRRSIERVERRASCARRAGLGRSVATGEQRRKARRGAGAEHRLHKLAACQAQLDQNSFEG